MLTHRTCCFCGKPADSHEHVIPEWLSKAMHRRDFLVVSGRFNSEDGWEARPPVRFKNLKTRQVCSSCNNGWMSQLESAFMSVALPLVSPKNADISEELLAQLGKAHNLTIRWMLKTAVVVEQAMPKGNQKVITDSMIAIASGKTVDSNCHLFAAIIGNPDFVVHFTKGHQTWNGGKLHNYQIHHEGIAFGLQLNHLGLFLIRSPDAKVGINCKLALHDGRHCAPMIDGNRLVAEGFRFVPFFPVFTTFLDSVEVHATQH